MLVSSAKACVLGARYRARFGRFRGEPSIEVIEGLAVPVFA